MSARRVLHDLALLLHPERLERAAVVGFPGVGIPAQAEPAMEQMAKLDRDTAQVVAQWSPGLVLGAVSELVGEDGGIGLAAIRQEDPIPQRDRAPAQGSETVWRYAIERVVELKIRI